MKKPDFEELLTEYRSAAVPALPSSFSSNVLREIRLRNSPVESEPGWLLSLLSCLRPGLIAASLSIALAVGFFLPGLARGNDHETVAAGLGLNIFSPSSPQMLSGLLK